MGIYATAWEYDRKLWTFGGAGIYPHHYIRAYGEWKHGGLSFIRGVKKIKTHFCNQLNCYDPNTNTWKNIRCYGTVPTPRIWAEATRFKHSVWLYGGEGGHQPSDMDAD